MRAVSIIERQALAFKKNRITKANFVWGNRTMQDVELYMVFGKGDINRISFGSSVDTVDEVVETSREFIKGPLQKQYPGLYGFAEYGIQAIESFSVKLTEQQNLTATIGMADLSQLPVFNREIAGKIAASFVTGLHINNGYSEEPALQLVQTNFAADWRNATFTVEPGRWLHRQLTSGVEIYLPSLQA